MSDDASPADYEPLQIVRDMHNLPHLNENLQRQSNDFDITHDEENNSYTQSLLPLPIIIGSLALFVLLSYHIYLCARCCCCQHYSEPPSPTEVKKDKERCISTRCKVLILFVICLLGVIICAQTFHFGNKSLTKAVNKLDDGLDYLKDTFNSLVSDGDTVDSKRSELSRLLYEAEDTGCPEAEALYEYIDDSYEYVDVYNHEVNEFHYEIDVAKDYVQELCVDYKNDNIIWVLYAMVLIAALFTSIGILLKSNCLIYFSITLSDLILIIMFYIVTGEMIFLMGLADFCMDPSDNLLKVVPNGIVNEFEFYTTCKGSNPLIDDFIFDEAQSFIDEARDGVNELLADECPGNNALEELLNVFDDIDDTIDSIEDTARCKPTLHALESVLNNGLCNKAFRGRYLIWLGQYLSATFLVLLLIVASFSFYRPQVLPTNESDDNEIEMTPELNSQERSHGPTDRGNLNFRNSSSAVACLTGRQRNDKEKAALPFAISDPQRQGATVDGWRISEERRQKLLKSNAAECDAIFGGTHMSASQSTQSLGLFRWTKMSSHPSTSDRTVLAVNSYAAVDSIEPIEQGDKCEDAECSFPSDPDHYSGTTSGHGSSDAVRSFLTIVSAEDSIRQLTHNVELNDNANDPSHI